MGLHRSLFTVEYIARLACVRRPLRYARSVFGIIDLLAVLPTYIAVLVPGLHALIDVRVLRLLRHVPDLQARRIRRRVRGARSARWRASRRKILVFLSFVLLVVLVMGTLMYVVEGPEHGFTSIPVGVYWAITTMTTVGFGDITPQTDLGRVIASVMMLLGLGHAGGADRHRQRRVHRAAIAARADDAHLPRMPERGPFADRAVLPRLRRRCRRGMPTAARGRRRRRRAGRHRIALKSAAALRLSHPHRSNPAAASQASRAHAARLLRRGARHLRRCAHRGRRGAHHRRWRLR